MKYYTYAHLNPDTLLPFYIGKGCGNRHKDTKNRNTNWYLYVEKHGFVHAIIQRFESEADALESEIKMIAYFRSKEVWLANIAAGGEGAYAGNTHALGTKRTEEIRKAMSARLVGNKRLLGHKHSDATKQKIGAAAVGNKYSRSIPEQTIMEVFKLRANGKKQEEIANITGLQQSRVSKIERLLFPYYKEVYGRYKDSLLL